MTEAGGILLAAGLPPGYPWRVAVVGRDLARAGELAAIGHGARSRRANVADPAVAAASLDGIAPAVSCIDQPEPARDGGAQRRAGCPTPISRRT